MPSRGNYVIDLDEAGRVGAGGELHRVAVARVDQEARENLAVAGAGLLRAGVGRRGSRYAL